MSWTNDHTVITLRNALREHDLIVHGTKAELLARLNDNGIPCSVEAKPRPPSTPRSEARGRSPAKKRGASPRRSPAARSPAARSPSSGGRARRSPSTGVRKRKSATTSANGHSSGPAVVLVRNPNALPGGIEDPADATLFSHPFITLGIFIQLVWAKVYEISWFLLTHPPLMWSLVVAAGSLICANSFTGAHTPYLSIAFDKGMIWGWWLFLGIMSSVGLGFGLHTFVLYLGPHIIMVTITAYDCNSIHFNDEGYWTLSKSEELDCASLVPGGVSFTSIWAKIQMECFWFGLGTAIGELPPYFVARAARIQDDELDELKITDTDGMMYRVKQSVLSSMERFGFFAILLFASIPNPLFDLAGLTCGYLLIPFSTFFLATAIGKAVIKVQGQALFYIALFAEDHYKSLINFIEGFVSSKWLLEKLECAKETKHGQPADHSPSLISTLFNYTLMVCIFLFVKGIIEGMVQAHLTRLQRADKSLKKIVSAVN